jgi:hypothetical protein
LDVMIGISKRNARSKIWTLSFLQYLNLGNDRQHSRRVDINKSENKCWQYIRLVIGVHSPSCIVSSDVINTWSASSKICYLPTNVVWCGKQ